MKIQKKKFFFFFGGGGVGLGGGRVGGQGECERRIEVFGKIHKKIGGGGGRGRGRRWGVWLVGGGSGWM